VEADLAATGKADPGHGTPPRFFHCRTPDVPLSECGDLSVQVVTQEIEFVPDVLAGGMHGDLCRRQREDQPAAAGIHRWKSENFAQERAISRRVFAVHDDMGTEDHELAPFARLSE